jgi:hypothetical protein
MYGDGAAADWQKIIATEPVDSQRIGTLHPNKICIDFRFVKLAWVDA